jgi:hypothetical protein
MASQAIFGFIGVILGSLTTSVLTIYRERVITRRQLEIRDQQYERDRKAARDTFQRESIPALQSAVFDVIKAVYDELDRILAELRNTGAWPARQWETPTAAGWSAAVLKLESSRARVFDDELRSLAEELRTVAGDAVWAEDRDTAERLSRPLELLQRKFQERVPEFSPLCTDPCRLLRRQASERLAEDSVAHHCQLRGR